MIVSFIRDGHVLIKLDTDVIPTRGEHILLPPIQNSLARIKRQTFLVDKVIHNYRILKEENNLVICTTAVYVVDQ